MVAIQQVCYRYRVEPTGTKHLHEERGCIMKDGYSIKVTPNKVSVQIVITPDTEANVIEGYIEKVREALLNRKEGVK